MHIGLCGPNGSGKTSLAELLRYEKSYVVIDFAKQIENAFDAIFPSFVRYRMVRELKDKPLPLWGFSYRDFAKNFGSFGLLGKLHPNWFMISCLDTVERASEQNKSIVFSNVRTGIQAEFIKKHFNAHIIFLKTDEDINTCPDLLKCIDTFFIVSKDYETVETDFLELVNKLK